MNIRDDQTAKNMLASIHNQLVETDPERHSLFRVAADRINTTLSTGDPDQKGVRSSRWPGQRWIGKPMGRDEALVAWFAVKPAVRGDEVLISRYEIVRIPPTKL